MRLPELLLAATITVASWYGYTGVTANGEKFDGSGMTAASRTLPFGTLVKIERVDDGRFIIVRINDRGPFVKGRGIDLSREAFSNLGKLGEGLIRVRVTVLEGSHNW